jgi:hypothetical protein
MQRLLDSLTESILRSESRGEPVGPTALTFLLHRYAANGRDDVRLALERGLTAAIERGPADEISGAPAWIRMLCEAAAVTDDDRLVGVIGDGVVRLRQTWPSRGAIASAMATIDACLTTVHVPRVQSQEAVSAAIDELERVVSRVYRPGEPIAHSLAAPDASDGDLDDHVADAASLLTAYVVTGRLPYSMLAEELMHSARPLFAAGAFAARCEGARVLCRIATLHADESYRAAVVSSGRDYLGEARHLVDALDASREETPEAVGIYALAIDDLISAT